MGIIAEARLFDKARLKCLISTAKATNCGKKKNTFSFAFFVRFVVIDLMVAVDNPTGSQNT